ncbi:MAG: FAD-binding protein [Alphaproteobacteria bacterium]|jgi:flavin-dependent dehydrogenase|nr:FAD-binding protein [Alphaproteobacteria bacterium]
MSEPTDHLWDVIVIGAGPAGSVAAQQCAARGGSVLLVDRAGFPRHKVCGCCLNSVALAILDRAGMGQAVRRAGGSTLSQLDLSAGGRGVRLDLPPGLAISRAALDAALIDQATAAGVRFLPEAPATVGEVNGTARHVIVRINGRDRRFRTRLVVAATGLAGLNAKDLPELRRRPVRSARIGCSAILDGAPDEAAGVIHMACGRGGYVGLTRLEDGRLNAAAAVDPKRSRVEGGVANLVRSILGSAGNRAPAGLDEAAWQGTPRLTGRPRRVTAERLVLIGDAAGYVEPFTGEGMAWAMISGVAAAQLIVEAQFDAGRIVRRWPAEYRRRLAARQRRCRLIANLLRRPVLTAWVVRAVAANQGLAAPLIGAIHRPARPSDLAVAMGTGP